MLLPGVLVPLLLLTLSLAFFVASLTYCLFMVSVGSGQGVGNPLTSGIAPFVGAVDIPPLGGPPGHGQDGPDGYIPFAPPPAVGQLGGLGFGFMPFAPG